MNLLEQCPMVNMWWLGTREKQTSRKRPLPQQPPNQNFLLQPILTKKRSQESPLVPSTRCPFPLSGPSSLLMQQGAQDPFPVILPYSSPSHSSANCTLVELVRPNHKYKNQRRMGNPRTTANVTQCHDDTRKEDTEKTDCGKMSKKLKLRRKYLSYESRTWINRWWKQRRNDGMDDDHCIWGVGRIEGMQRLLKARVGEYRLNGRDIL